MIGIFKSKFKKKLAVYNQYRMDKQIKKDEQEILDIHLKKDKINKKLLKCHDNLYELLSDGLVIQRRFTNQDVHYIEDEVKTYLSDVQLFPNDKKRKSVLINIFEEAAKSGHCSKEELLKQLNELLRYCKLHDSLLNFETEVAKKILREIQSENLKRKFGESA